MSKWTNEASSLVLSASVAGLHEFLYKWGWWYQNLTCSEPMALGPKHWEEGWEGLLLVSSSSVRLQQMMANRHGLSHKARFAKDGGRHGMMDSTLHQEPGILSFSPTPLLTGCAISKTSLDFNFQIWKMHRRDMGLIQGFSNFSLPRILFMEFSPFTLMFWKCPILIMRKIIIFIWKVQKKWTGNQPSITTNKTHE